MIEGLHSYESALLFCGVLLFIALLVVMFVHLSRKQSVMPVFGGFLIPVVMIGFPGIQKVGYENGKITIEKYARTPPEEPAKRQELINALEKVESRTPPKAQNYELLARGFAAANQPQRALARATHAINLGADSQKLAPLITRTSVQVIDQVLPAGQTKVSDAAKRAELEKAITRLQAQPALPAAAMVDVSRALVAVGRESEAAKTLAQAAQQAPQLRTNPKFQAVMRDAKVTPQ